MAQSWVLRYFQAPKRPVDALPPLIRKTQNHDARVAPRRVGAHVGKPSIEGDQQPIFVAGDGSQALIGGAG